MTDESEALALPTPNGLALPEDKPAEPTWLVRAIEDQEKWKAKGTRDDHNALAVLRLGQRQLPAEIGPVSLECWACGDKYTPLVMQDHPAFGGARLCQPCRTGEKKLLESWTMEYDAEHMDRDDFLEAPADALVPAEQAKTKALAILALEFLRFDPARAHALMTSYVEFQDPAVRAILERPREALEAALGRKPREQPKDVASEAKDAKPPALLGE